MRKAPGTEVEELILCKNPTCNSRKGGRYKAGRSWTLHLRKSPSCHEYYTKLAENENSGEAGGANPAAGAGPSFPEGDWIGANNDWVGARNDLDGSNEEPENVECREWRTQGVEGAAVRSEIQGGTYWEQRRQLEDPLNPCAPWRDTTELELAEWLISSGLPEAKIDTFLNLKYVSLYGII